MSDEDLDGELSWNARVPLVAGIAALVTLIGGLGVWSVGAELSSAVVASGQVKVESNRQVIQHPEGGVVAEIFVKESSRVQRSDVLIRLDGRRFVTELSIVGGQLREIAARKARLGAERDGATQVAFPADLIEVAGDAPEIDAIIEGERLLFQSRYEAWQQEISLINEQNLQIDNRIQGLEAQLDALYEQSALVQADLDAQKKLLENNLTRAAGVSDLKRGLAGLNGQIGRLDAEMAGLRGQKASNGIALLQLSTQRREGAVSRLRDLDYREIELTERKSSLEETVSRLDIRAPTSGIVYDLQVFALQSVVQPAQALMYIIPQDQPLVVSARVESINIDEVFAGQEAALQFSSFDQRDVSEIKGKVERISADVIQDDVTGQSYYAVEIMPNASEISKLNGQSLLPGMPVESFIQTGNRSPLAYLLEPVSGFFNRAMRE